MDKLLTSETKDSDALRPSSSPWLSERNCLASTKSLINPSSSATSMSEKNSTPTLLWAVEPPCSLVSPIDWARKSLLWLPPQWRLRSWLLKKESSSSGSVAQSSPRSPPSTPCGSPKPSIKKPVSALSIENASDRIRLSIKSINYPLSLSINEGSLLFSSRIRLPSIFVAHPFDPISLSMAPSLLIAVDNYLIDSF